MRGDRQIFEHHRRRIVRRCHVVDGRGGRFARGLAALREAIPCALACHGASDPETSMPITHADDDPRSGSYLTAIWDNEYATPDVNKFRLLARTQTHVGLLSQATDNQLWRSPRYATIFRGIGLEHELRATLMADSAMWGYLVLLRPPTTPDFSAAEVALLVAVAPHLAEAQRADHLAAALGAPRDRGTPGLLVLSAADDVLATTTQAEALLEELGRGLRSGRRLPEAVYIVAAAARAAALGALDGSSVPRVRLRTPSGRWLVVHGARLNSSVGQGQVAITIEPAQASDVASLLVRAYDFTDRERQVVLLVLQGFATDEIAQRLCVSPYTVQDHLKAIFDKAAVRGRRELVAEVFYRHQSARI